MARRLEQRPALPPRELWLIEPGERIDTPTDSRGIVDIAKTIVAVKACIDPSHEWTGRPDNHHFEWPEANFPYVHRNGVPNPAVFRELPPNRGLIPGDFHEFTHTVTAMPPVPSPEVMGYQIGGWKVAHSLFEKAREVFRGEREFRRYLRFTADKNGFIDSESAQAIMREIFEKDFRGLDRHLEENDRIPPEFRFFDSRRPLGEIAGDLGRIVVPRAPKFYKAVTA